MPTPVSRRPIVLDALDAHVDEIARLSARLVPLCQELDIELLPEQAELCVKHLFYVQQVNAYMNLTRIKDMDEALVLHVLDSLALSRMLPIEPEHFLDMGTGAGFPGIPFAILSETNGVLLDSVGKKVDAVNAFARALGLDMVKGVHDRLENYAMDKRGFFDVVFARAVGQLPLLIEYATPFLEDGGYLVLAKARPSQDELSAGFHVASICGLEHVATDEFELPFDMGHRTVLLFQKVDEPSVKLPRPVGMAKKEPLH